jgi:tetratricopeptide (TPR) repeat protein
MTTRKKTNIATTKRKADVQFTDQWGEPEPAKPPKPPRSQKEAAAANRLADEWSKVSAAVARARQSPEPTTTNQLLADQAKDDPKGPLTPAYAAWAADNLMMEARFDEAIETYRDVATRYDGHPLAATPLWPHVFEQRAACHERMGKPDEAVAVYEELIKRSPKSPERALWQFRIGQIAEAAGNDNLAINAYGRAAKTGGSPEHAEGSIQDLALRCESYLRSPGNPLPQARDLSTALASALRDKSIDELQRLASRTHFTLGGASSERLFVDADKVLGALKADLNASKVRVDPTALRGGGDKLYLMTSGWAGRLCAGVVFFVLTRRRAGWEWGGIALTQLGAGFDDLLPPPEREENQSLRIRIKAPWPAGQCFRAGGVVQFGFIAAGGPLAWWIASLSDSCGFGTWGFYYNMVGHSGIDAFAIDFTRNASGVPWGDLAGGTPALSVFGGVVSVARDNFASGDATLDNRVEVDHQDPLEVLFALIFRVPLPQPKYRSKYLHLAGPTMLNVSPMMIVAQGSRLGPMDDTGNSAVNHLHFSIHDRDLGFMSVRPNPMDNQTLNDFESGKCICSTNVPV